MLLTIMCRGPIDLLNKDAPLHRAIEGLGAVVSRLPWRPSPSILQNLIFGTHRCNDPELGKMGPDCIDHCGLLTDEQMARAVQHQAALLLGSLGWHEPHVGPGDCLANGLCVSRVILLPLDVGLHIGRRYQPHLVTQRMELARPMVRRSASLYADQAW